MQRLEVSCAVRRIYTPLGAKGLRDPTFGLQFEGDALETCTRARARPRTNTNIFMRLSVNSME